MEVLLGDMYNWFVGHCPRWWVIVVESKVDAPLLILVGG